MSNKEVVALLRKWVADPAAKCDWPLKDGERQFRRFAKYIDKNWGKKKQTFNEFVLDYANKLEKMPQ